MNEKIIMLINGLTKNFGITVVLISAVMAAINILLKETTKNQKISGITGIMRNAAESGDIEKNDIKIMLCVSAVQIIKMLWFIESVSIFYILCYETPAAIESCKFLIFGDLLQKSENMYIPIICAIIGFILSNFGNYKNLVKRMMPSALGLALTIILYSLMSRVLNQAYFVLSLVSQLVLFTYSFISWCLKRKNHMNESKTT